MDSPLWKIIVEDRTSQSREPSIVTLCRVPLELTVVPPLCFRCLKEPWDRPMAVSGGVAMISAAELMYPCFTQSRDDPTPAMDPVSETMLVATWLVTVFAGEMRRAFRCCVGGMSVLVPDVLESCSDAGCRFAYYSTCSMFGDVNAWEV